MDSVLFKVRPGEYTERVEIKGFLNSDKKVTFEGESGDSTEVVLRYPFGPALILGGVRNFTLRHMTFASGIEIQSAYFLLLESNVVIGGIDDFSPRNITYRNNHFKEQGINKRGPGYEDQGGVTRFWTSLGVVIQGNIFHVKETAIGLFALEDVVIEDNQIIIEDSKDARGFSAIGIGSSLDIKEINNNTIISHRSNVTGITSGGGFFCR